MSILRKKRNDYSRKTCLKYYTISHNVTNAIKYDY